MLFPVIFKKLSQEQTSLLEHNKTEFTANARCDHQGHLGFDISHNRFPKAILERFGY